MCPKWGAKKVGKKKKKIFSKLQFMQRFSQIFLPTSFYDNWVLNAIGNIGDNDIQLRNADQLQIVHSNLTI